MLLLLLNLYAVKLIAYEVWADDWLSFWQMSNYKCIPYFSKQTQASQAISYLSLYVSVCLCPCALHFSCHCASLCKYFATCCVLAKTLTQSGS